MSDNTIETLLQRQSLPLEAKIKIAKQRITEWYEFYEGDVYVSFSGGKDSTVLMNLVKELYPNVPAVFIDTGLEYPEVREFALKYADIVLKPKLSFVKVIKKYGYPIISKEQAKYIHEFRTTTSDSLRNKRLNGDEKGRFKISNKWQRVALESDYNISHYCCDVMKKRPSESFEKQSGLHPIIGTMANESSLRKNVWLKYGCNEFNKTKRPTSKPLSVWLEQDILEYLYTYNIEYCSIYGEIKENNDGFYTTGADRTGCIFCGFGCHLEQEPNRFQRLKETHPNLYEYCIRGGQLNDEGVWEPHKGLGMAHLLDDIGVSY